MDSHPESLDHIAPYATYPKAPLFATQANIAHAPSQRPQRSINQSPRRYLHDTFQGGLPFFKLFQQEFQLF